MEEKIKKEILRILHEDNPGILPDEAELEAERILYRKNTYEQAKWNTFK
jgi:hypothetical protein